MGRDEKGKFQPGSGGRPKGVPNKLSKSVRETVLEVFNKLQNDPDHSLEQFAKNEPAEFYRIAAKLIPTEVTGKIAITPNLYEFEPDTGSEPIQD